MVFITPRVGSYTLLRELFDAKNRWEGDPSTLDLTPNTAGISHRLDSGQTPRLAPNQEITDRAGVCLADVRAEEFQKATLGRGCPLPPCSEGQGQPP